MAGRDSGRHAGSRDERATGTPHQYITRKADVLRWGRGWVKAVRRGRLSESVKGSRLAGLVRCSDGSSRRIVFEHDLEVASWFK
jgi:hypothetical protein